MFNGLSKITLSSLTQIVYALDTWLIMPGHYVTRQMTSAIWRISARLNIPSSPELAEKQANEDGHLSIEVSI